MWEAGEAGSGLGALAEAVEGEAIAAVDAGFLEDVLEVDFDGAGADAEGIGDFAVAEALFDEVEDLGFAGGEFAAAGALEAAVFAEDALLEPGRAEGDGAEAGFDGVEAGGFAEEAASAGLEEAEGFSLAHGAAPDDDCRSGAGEVELEEGIEHGLLAEGLVDEDGAEPLLPGHLDGNEQGGSDPGAFEVLGGRKQRPDPLGGSRLSFTEADLVFGHTVRCHVVGGGVRAGPPW